MSETISTRVPEEIRKEVEEFMKEENLDKSAAVRKLLKTGLGEWRKRRALTLLEKEEVSFNKAAEIAGMNLWDFADLLKKSGRNWITSMEKIRSDIETVKG